MEENHRKIIIKNFVSLVEQTDLDKMVAALYEKGVFSEQMIEPFNDTSKDQRSRKRLLYSNITRRGPRAFGHLLEALGEAGYWDLARDLDPTSPLHPRPRSTFSTKSDESQYVSIKNEKKKTKTVVGEKKDIVISSPGLQVSKVSDPPVLPTFNVIKSTHFMEDTDEGSKIKLYRTRGPNRGYLVVFSYITFDHNIEEYRAGADVDCQNLKYLFVELGFRVASYQNLTENETLQTLKSLQDSCVSKCECLFIVVSSHGHPRHDTTDINVRVSDGGLISAFSFIDYFNDKNFPALRGVPKVFIFQVCRGNKTDWVNAGAVTDGQSRAPVPTVAEPPPTPRRDRVYSDILVAHSTLPGYVSHRDERRGSWFIQALCKVFAAHAHDTDVEKLFALVDDVMRKDHSVQTSERKNWGFNRRLYLHPGLVEEATPAAAPVNAPVPMSASEPASPAPAT